jgi:hypothetical protein
MATSPYLYSKKERKQKFQCLMLQINMIPQYLRAASTLTTLFARMYKFENDGMVLLWMLTLT